MAQPRMPRVSCSTFVWPAPGPPECNSGPAGWAHHVCTLFGFRRVCGPHPCLPISMLAQAHGHISHAHCFSVALRAVSLRLSKTTSATPHRHQLLHSIGVCLPAHWFASRRSTATHAKPDGHHMFGRTALSLFVASPVPLNKTPATPDGPAKHANTSGLRLASSEHI